MLTKSRLSSSVDQCISVLQLHTISILPGWCMYVFIQNIPFSEQDSKESCAESVCVIWSCGCGGGGFEQGFSERGGGWGWGRRCAAVFHLRLETGPLCLGLQLLAKACQGVQLSHFLLLLHTDSPDFSTFRSQPINRLQMTRVRVVLVVAKAAEWGGMRVVCGTASRGPVF